MNTCSYCNSTSFSVVNTYKHKWRQCNDCGNVVRARKARYLFEGLPPLAWRVLPGVVEKALTREVDVVQDDAAYYAYYHRIAATGSAAGTKWESEYDALILKLDELGISLKDKSVLDISGGPGFLVKRLQDVARRAVVTEYSWNASSWSSGIGGSG